MTVATCLRRSGAGLSTGPAPFSLHLFLQLCGARSLQSTCAATSIRPPLLHRIHHVEDRQVHRHDHTAHHDAEEHDHDRLEQ